MSKQVMLRVPDGVYEELEKLAASSMRPVASEALFRMRLGMLLSDFSKEGQNHIKRGKLLKPAHGNKGSTI